jgi:hypothetical protein
MSFKPSNKPLDALPTKLLRYAEYLAEGHDKSDALRRVGMSPGSITNAYIGPTRERSKYPALWDHYQQLRNRRLRLFDVNAETIRDELKVIAFAKITNYIAIPTRRDLERQQLFDAKIRRSFGYHDDDDDAILSREHEIRQNISGSKSKKSDDIIAKYAPGGGGLKLKCLDDIPEELLPAIESISETKDGIRVKLFNKLEALDMLARIAKLYDRDEEDKKPIVIENMNIVVSGSRSELLKKIQSEQDAGTENNLEVDRQ